MIPVLVRLAALAVLLAPSAPSSAAREDAVPPDLEFAVVSVMDGISGGFVGPTPRVMFAAAYDRVEHGFRAWRLKGEPGAEELWAATLTPEQFRSLLELACSSGLPSLPVENPPGCIDVYGRNIQVRLEYRETHWVNGAAGGCDQIASKTVPSDEQRDTFDCAIERLKEAVDALPLHVLDGFAWAPIPFFGDAHAAETCRRVMKHVLSDPIRDRLDLERVRASGDRAIFCWRGASTSENIDDDVHFMVEASGKVVRAPSRGDNLPADRRFVPIQTGMTLEDVLARLGQPDLRVQLADGSVVLTYHPCGIVRQWLFAPARLRFENGRLASP